MEVVQEFLRLRREGKSDEAIDLLATDACFSAPWGGMKYGDNVRLFLRDEPTFVRKGYLTNVPVEKIDENTFQRQFKFDRGMFEYGNGGYWFGILPVWREIYFVKDGKIRLVTANKQPRDRTLSGTFNTFCSLFRGDYYGK